MEYIAVNIILDPHQEETEGILVAELDAIGYEGFQTEEHVMTAYVPAKTYNETHLRIVLNTYGIQDFTKTYIPYKNWNADWELRFSPILLEAGKGCSVRAPKNGSMVPVWPEVAYKLVIKPELAFGTGHHPTTLMMMEALLTMEQAGLIKNKRVLDFGTGTGILAILAAKMGAAAPVHALDTNIQSVRSCRENALLNKADQQIRVHHAGPAAIQKNRYGLILANIHRNVLIEEMDTMARGLEPGTSRLLLSGFFTTDIPAFIEAGQKNNLTLYEQKENEGWSLLHFTKTT